MRVLFPALIAFGLAAPAAAQEVEPEPYFEGLNQFAEGMRKLLEGLADDLEPMMNDLAGQLDDLRGYHPPEILPNGDIIIRRKTPEEREKETPRPEDGIEL